MNELTCLWPECTSTDHQARGYCRVHYVYWRRAQKLNTQHARTCTECGASFTTEKASQIVCSRACRARAAQRAATPHITAGKVAARIARTTPVLYVPKPAPPTPVTTIRGAWWVAGNCAVCRTPFVSCFGDRSCSAECQMAYRRALRNEHKQQRRARKRNAFVAPVYRAIIFARDAYTCQLCNLPMEMDKQGPDPKAPTIDHIIPLALGGTHEPSNVQSACFLCNSTKGARLDWVA